MAMNVGMEEDEGSPMSDINTTPLVDVMLVLLIIFLITVPVVIQTVPLQLPQVTNLPLQTKPENILLSVNRDGDVFWGTQVVTDKTELRNRLVERVVDAVQSGRELPEVHIRGDKDTPFQNIGGVIFTAQTAGVQKIGFISEPIAGTVTR